MVTFSTEDRWDPVAAKVGGTWDTLLERGENIWAAVATSDYHNEKGDYAPCAFARTHVLAAGPSAAAVMAAYKAGSFWADHGFMLDKLTLEASLPGLARPAIPGEAVSVRPDDAVTVRLALERGEGAAGAPLTVEVIENCSTGTPTLSLETTLAPTEDDVEKRLGDLQKGVDQHSCFVRARVRKDMGRGPDLMAYTNPIRFQTAHANVFSVLPTLRASPLIVSIGAVGVVVLVSALAMFGFRRRAIKTGDVSPPARSSFDYASQLLGTSIHATDDRSPIELGIRGRGSVGVEDSQLRASYLLLNEQRLDTRTRNSSELTVEAVARLRSLFLEEQKHPLDVETERRIDVCIEYATEEMHKHPLNFYYRVGNNRATHHSFEDSIEQAIWWHGFLGVRLQPLGQSQKAPAEVSNQPRKTPAAVAYHDTVVAIQPGADKPRAVAADVSIADELERLVRLRDEDLLSDKEFAIAKAKLLQ